MIVVEAPWFPVATGTSNISSGLPAPHSSLGARAANVASSEYGPTTDALAYAPTRTMYVRPAMSSTEPTRDCAPQRSSLHACGSWLATLAGHPVCTLSTVSHAASPHVSNV